MAHHGPPADYKFPTIDDLPVPCGSWKEDYDNKQRKYLIHLILGTGFFIITMAVVCIFLNVNVSVYFKSNEIKYVKFFLFQGVTTGSFDLYITAPQKPSPPIKY